MIALADANDYGVHGWKESGERHSLLSIALLSIGMTDGTITNTKIVDAEFIRDLFQPFGAVTIRRMFGGAGLFADGVMFGLVSGGQIYLKADATTVTCFEREQCGPFEYSTKNGKRTLTSYWRLPDRLYDDADELAQWARQALGAARQNAAAKPRAGKRRTKTR